MGRYLSSLKGHAIKFQKSPAKVKTLRIVSDTNWVGDRVDRGTTGCYHMILEKNLLANRVRGFAIINLSSGENEFYGGVAGVCDAKHIVDILKFIGFDVKVQLEMDASAAIGVCARLGVGSLRHIEAKTLWIQKLVQDGEFAIKKIP